MASLGLSYLASSQCLRMHCLGCCIMQVFPGGSDGKESTCNAGNLGLILGWEDPLEKEMATHSSIPA